MVRVPKLYLVDVDVVDLVEERVEEGVNRGVNQGVDRGVERVEEDVNEEYKYIINIKLLYMSSLVIDTEDLTITDNNINNNSSDTISIETRRDNIRQADKRQTLKGLKPRYFRTWKPLEDSRIYNSRWII